MKKVLQFAVLCVFVAGMSLPAFALETDFSGSFYVEGILNSAPNMLDSDSTSDYRQMRLRVQTDFQVSDNLKLTTRFDALEKVLSSKNSAFNIDGAGTNEDNDNISFDRAYLTYISPIGMFEVGRLKGIVWGTSFCDDESDTDRIKYTVPIEMGDGKLYMIAVAEKVGEYNTMQDDDNDKYYLGAVYKTEQYSTGLLSAMYSFNKFQDPGQSYATRDLTASYDANKNASSYQNSLLTKDKGAADSLTSYSTWYGTNAYKASKNIATDSDWSYNADTASALTTFQTRGKTNDAKVFLLAPYFQGKFGDYSLEAELDYVFGTLKYENVGTLAVEDRDVKGYAYFAQGAYDYSPFTAQLGFASASGDADHTDKDIECIGYVSPGVDWEKLFILNSDYHGMNGTLGNGLGNHIGTGFGTPSTAMLDGYQMLYGGIDYAVTDDITLGVIAAMSKADDVPEDVVGKAYDDDQGMEYDFTFTWNITDNLTYKAIAAYLDGGDYWQTRKTGKIEKTTAGDDLVDPQVYTLFHRLTLTF